MKDAAASAADRPRSVKPDAIARRRLLYVTPVVPQLTGSGLEMRAGIYLDVLATLFDVTLAIVAENSVDTASQLPSVLAARCCEIIVQTRKSAFTRIFGAVRNKLLLFAFQAIWPRASTARVDAAVRMLSRRLASRHFDVVYCFRLRTSRFPKFYRRYGGTFSISILDMDDFESRAAWRQALNMRRTAGIRHCIGKLVDVPKLAIREAASTGQFTKLGVCSQADKDTLKRRFPRVDCIILPNAIRRPPGHPPLGHAAFTFLFVGTLSYMPNQDAVCYFCRDIMPLVRAGSPQAVRFLIVGRDAGPNIRALAASPGIELVENPPGVSRWYAEADAAVVPLRAGGGTRIKILEAFAHGLPVVSTTLGAEGLELAAEVDALIADDPTNFAAHCVRLMLDQQLRARIAARGRVLAETTFSIERLRSLLAVLPGSPEMSAPAASEGALR